MLVDLGFWMLLKQGEMTAKNYGDLTIMDLIDGDFFFRGKAWPKVQSLVHAHGKSLPSCE